jgi:hypothetical protein
MDNNTLINEARQLYAALEVEQHTQFIGNKARFNRLEHVVVCAYCRYQRRLNRCVLCYQHRLTECFRDIFGVKRQFCPKANMKHINKVITSNASSEETHSLER